MNIIKTELEDVLIIEPEVHRDKRGYFIETWNLPRYQRFCFNKEFVQDSISFSSQRVLRGLHYQFPNPQGKLIQVLQGKIFDVAVDIRKSSSTFGCWTGVVLSSKNHRQFYIPEGFAHGFYVTSKTALVSYKFTHIYEPNGSRGILWNDPNISVNWPGQEAVISDGDRKQPLLKNVLPEYLF